MPHDPEHIAAPAEAARVEIPDQDRELLRRRASEVAEIALEEALRG